MSSHLLQGILETADELTDPHVHVERVRVGWTKSRNPVYAEHKTTQPGLIAQLYQAAVEPVVVLSEVSARAKPKSRPPLAVEAMSRYLDICVGAMRWISSTSGLPRQTPESNIRALVGMATRFDLDTAEALHQELKQWRRWSAVLTGWQTPPWKPRISCPVCEASSSIWVSDSSRSAYCGECGFSWDDALDLAETVRAAA